MSLLIVALISLLGGVVQTVTGFGAGIINMLVFPYLFGIVASSAINGTINLFINFLLAFSLRKYINYKKILFPTIISMCVCTVAISAIPYLPIDTLKLIFSIFIVLLAIYFNFFNKVVIKDNWKTMLICTIVSGITNGWFAIAGPTMVVYYLACCKGKEEYIGTIQSYFFLTSIYATIIRLSSGILTKDTILPILIGIGFAVVGKIFGSKIMDKISAEKMKKYIYYFLAVVGVIQLIQCF